MMAKLYDKSPLQYIKEEYIGYGRNDLEKMDKKELENEIKRVNKELTEIACEFNNSKSETPTFSLKEQEKTLIHYREKIEKELKDRFSESETTENAISDMILDLDQKLEKGLITEEYHDKYVKKLKDSLNRVMTESAERPTEEQKKKMRLFKKKLSEYSQKQRRYK